MVILQIHNTYKFKGGEDSVVEAEKSLLEKHGHTVISLYSHNKNIKNIFIERKKIYKKLHHILRNQHIDVVHIHNVFQMIGSEVYKVVSKKKIPIVQTLHNFRFLCPAGLFLDNSNNICEDCAIGKNFSCSLKKCYQNSYIKSLLMQIVVNKATNIVHEHVDIFIALNKFYESKFIQYGFAKEKFIIKPNFLNETNEIKNISDGEYALFIGRLSPEKGIINLIEAFKNLKFKLLIAGTGDINYTNSLKQICANYPNIEFVGFVAGNIKNNLIANSSFVVIPSIWYENFPITILEAYSNFKPVIASNLGGLTNLVEHQETGYLYDAHSVSDLTISLQEIIRDKKYISLGKKAHELFLGKYTDVQNYIQLMQIYIKAIEGKKKLNYE